MKLTEKDWEIYNNAVKCHICEREFKEDEKKVKDHCHITGEFRGAAHNSCNLNFRLSPKIPVFFHNLRGYDSHIIMQAANNSEEIEVIANNIEKYMSIRLGHNIIFKDSLQFLNGSLDKLTKSLHEDDFILTSRLFPDPENLKLMLRKGLCPYNYLDSWERLNETEPPPHSAFFNELTNENITEDEYKHFIKVWETFNIQNLGEYLDLYLLLDVYLLADVFENFRNSMIMSHNLDPSHYITSPHF